MNNIHSHGNIEDMNNISITTRFHLDQRITPQRTVHNSHQTRKTKQHVPSKTKAIKIDPENVEQSNKHNPREKPPSESKMIELFHPVVKNEECITHTDSPEEAMVICNTVKVEETQNTETTHSDYFNINLMPLPLLPASTPDPTQLMAYNNAVGSQQFNGPWLNFPKSMDKFTIENKQPQLLPIKGSHNHTCQYCGKVFKRPWVLKVHERSHTGERPFTCPMCDHQFADRSNMRAHQRYKKHHQWQWKCSVCSKPFSQRQYLKRHGVDACRKYHQRTLKLLSTQQC